MIYTLLEQSQGKFSLETLLEVRLSLEDGTGNQTNEDEERKTEDGKRGIFKKGNL